MEGLQTFHSMPIHPEKRHKATAGPRSTVLRQRLPKSVTSMKDALQMHRHELVVDVLGESVGRPTSSPPMKKDVFQVWSTIM